ncbi:protein of unknown function [Kyrpidia spormannii]|uniref:Uncharacterized protein n=2 Tax=Kyrpidia spormannii TaxID=2055160 RepID=A0ACA8Z6T6_9BACL|nr:protein of unknown function [Kyrpidia spormannii]CAB3390469.1 protein of unknown function [Kyrpidia spormannii]
MMGTCGLTSEFWREELSHTLGEGGWRRSRRVIPALKIERGKGLWRHTKGMKIISPAGARLDGG